MSLEVRLRLDSNMILNSSLSIVYSPNNNVLLDLIKNFDAGPTTFLAPNIVVSKFVEGQTKKFHSYKFRPKCLKVFHGLV